MHKWRNNAQGRRVSRYDGTNTTVYVYDGDQVIDEYDGSGTLLRKFIYGPGIDEPICMIIPAAQPNAGTYWYHFDGLGSVVALSNNSGSIVEGYIYDAFGKCTVITSGGTDGSWLTDDGTSDTKSAYENPYQFTARRYDNETGLYYYRARMYKPDLGRFLQPDPIGYDDGMNMYAYVGNNPINFVDSMGLCKGALSKEEQYYRLMNYISSAEQEVIRNIERLKMMQNKQEFWQDYYDVLQITDATFTFATAIPAALKVASGVGLIRGSEVIVKRGNPLLGKGVDLVKQNAGNRALLQGLDSLTDDMVFSTIVGSIAATDINYARRKKMGQYDPYIEQIMRNISTLSSGVSSARAMIKEIGYAK